MSATKPSSIPTSGPSTGCGPKPEPEPKPHSPGPTQSMARTGFGREQDLEDRFTIAMETVKGVLSLVQFADYVDRTSDVLPVQLDDEAIRSACVGASHMADVASACFIEAYTGYLRSRPHQQEEDEQ